MPKIASTPAQARKEAWGSFFLMALEAINVADTMILDYYPPELEGNTFLKLLGSDLICGTLLQQPKEMKKKKEKEKPIVEKIKAEEDSPLPAMKTLPPSSKLSPFLLGKSQPSTASTVTEDQVFPNLPLVLSLFFDPNMHLVICQLISPSNFLASTAVNVTPKLLLFPVNITLLVNHHPRSQLAPHPRSQPVPHPRSQLATSMQSTSHIHAVN